MNRVFIYTRVSTQEQAAEGYSLGEQEERLKKYAEAMGWSVAQVFVDGGFSGGNMNRPALQSMIKAVNRHEADIVLVDKLDRLSRSQFDTLYLIQEIFTKNGVAFVSRAEAFDTSSAFGRAMVGILAVFAELERERIKERMAEGKVGRAKDGKWTGKVPTGYDYDPKSGNLIINPYEAEQVKMVINLFQQRVPVLNIANRMNAAGYKTKYGDWNLSTIKSIVQNRVYLGELHWKGESLRGNHEPIITEEVWQKSQAIMKERTKTFENYRPGRRYASPLAGMVWCEVCGGRYHNKTSGKNKDGTERRYYMCYSRAGTDRSMVIDPSCRNKNFRAEDLEKIIYSEIRKIKNSPIYIDEIRDSVNHKAIIAEIEKRIVAIDKQISRLMELYAIGSFDITAIRDKTNALNAEKRALEDELEAHKATTITQLSQAEIYGLVDMFEEAVAANDTAEINNIIAELIERITINYDEIKIKWKF